MTLNLWLVTMPLEYLDYVIMHELCHFTFKGHGPRFWRLLERTERPHLASYAVRRAGAPSVL
jgi:predicted metal-dependent hydrolase